MRGLIYFTAAAIDRARRIADPAERQSAQALAELLTPVAKAWCTDRGVEVASLGVQVHGGVGFIESTGAAQFYRDARIAPIYEGTNGIQAADLVGRKLLRDRGKAMRGLIDRIGKTLAACPGETDAPGGAIAAALKSSLGDLESATGFLLASERNDASGALAGAAPYLQLVGTVVAGWLFAIQSLAAGKALAEQRGDPAFLAGKLAVSRFYAENLMPHTGALALAATTGAQSVLALPEDQI
jgi:hypothetical protein